MNKFELITRNVEEVLTPEDLRSLLKSETPLRHYIGLEISGFVHLGTGLMSALKIRDFQEAGVKCNIFLADWHSWINEKLNGDLKTIKEIAVGYFKEALKICLDAVGADSSKVDFILGSDLYHHNDLYWLSLIEISKNVTLSRILRSIDIMGRKAGEAIDFAKLIYPPMQVADIFLLQTNIVHAGLDQRKAHVIARDVAENLTFSPLIDRNGKKIKPVVIHHHLLLGLSKPPKDFHKMKKDEKEEVLISLKMSKSKPESAIFIHDSSEEIEKKIKKAYCPPNDTEYNPVLDWTIWLLLPIFKEIKVKRSQGEKIYIQKEDLIKDYKDGLIHPLDLKEAVNIYLNKLIAPIRENFSSGLAKSYLERLKSII
jgi:tyrosyl-tRNA synthetase